MSSGNRYFNKVGNRVTERRNDFFTIAAVSVLAYFVSDLLHEGLGHGVTAWFISRLLGGAHKLTISTVALQSDFQSRWISANGTMVNLAAAAILWIALRRRYSPVLTYFLVMTMAANLFTGTGYFFFSGVTNFGDWAQVIHGLRPHWLWQAGLIAIGAASYYASMLVVAREINRFRPPIRSLCWTPYVTEAILAAVAGLFNPAGLFYVIASALPSTLGANAGLISIPFMIRGWKPCADPVDPIPRSPFSIVLGSIAAAFFVVILGRGLTFTL